MQQLSKSSMDVGGLMCCNVTVCVCCWCRFSRTVYEGRVEENSAPGQLVLTLHAHDPDAGGFGALQYDILDQTAEGTFRIDKEGVDTRELVGISYYHPCTLTSPQFTVISPIFTLTSPHTILTTTHSAHHTLHSLHYTLH